jgi:hypothetical protein
VRRRRFRRVRSAVKGSYPHAPNQLGNVQPLALNPSRTNIPGSILLPANGYSMCSLLFRCITFRPASDTGRGL